jgi:hypothetical protein
MDDERKRHADGPSWSRPMTAQDPSGVAPEEPATPARPDDEAIRATVTRLARRHPSGGTVIERAAILAEGRDGTAVVAWIIAHDGVPEAAKAVSASRGLHSARTDQQSGRDARPPLRYVLPAGALA